eukprot:2487303-Pyramimonas_sp.AAC.1
MVEDDEMPGGQQLQCSIMHSSANRRSMQSNNNLQHPYLAHEGSLPFPAWITQHRQVWHACTMLGYYSCD